METEMIVAAKTRDGKIYSRTASLGETLTEVVARIANEENLTPGELQLHSIGVRPDTFQKNQPVAGDPQVGYTITGQMIVWHSGPRSGMSKLMGQDGYRHVPPECVKWAHDCHVPKQYGGFRSNEVPCTCGMERTEGAFVCCALKYYRKIAQWEQRVKIVGLLKMNKMDLVQQLRLLWLLTDDDSEERADLEAAVMTIRKAYRQACWDIKNCRVTGVTQTFADAVLQHRTPTGAPIDEFLAGISLDFLVGKLRTVPFTGQMWPQAEQEIRKLQREGKSLTD